ncbi:hypothetical protein GCM10011329_07490 [Stakelama pacifica]|nr:hypothetical protein GCM10011329_07490 [Stakelama pacifica]
MVDLRPAPVTGSKRKRQSEQGQAGVHGVKLLQAGWKHNVRRRILDHFPSTKWIGAAEQRLATTANRTVFRPILLLGPTVDMHVSMRTRVKICCIASPAEAAMAIEAGADALG